MHNNYTVMVSVRCNTQNKYTANVCVKTFRIWIREVGFGLSARPNGYPDSNFCDIPYAMRKDVGLEHKLYHDHFINHQCSSNRGCAVCDTDICATF